MSCHADIVVAVDLGTTYTGVGWRTSRTPIQVINDWPGSGDRGERKVPSTVVYNADGTLSSWGFMCDDEDEDEDGGGGDDEPKEDDDQNKNDDEQKEDDEQEKNDDNSDRSSSSNRNTKSSGKIRREFFKLFIDNANLDAAQGIPRAPKNVDEAQRFATDFLAQVYMHVRETIEMQIGRSWTDMAVLFLFSVPTTWTRIQVINTFKGIIRNAGFGVQGPRHSAQVHLTEAEAAAVATLGASALALRPGSLFLAVDAGGGTTDLALMRVRQAAAAQMQLTQVAAVRGVGVGSTLIDRAFVRLVEQKLALDTDRGGGGDGRAELRRRLPVDCAARMARSHHFRTLKHKFGERAYMQPVFRMQMDGVSHDLTHAGAGIENGRLLFSILEIQTLFDLQIEGVMRQTREQLDWLLEKGMTDQVEFIILSGGLGSSAYVRQTMQQQLAALAHPNAKRTTVIPCQDPQLVVVRGLLLEQQQMMDSETSVPVVATRVARASYGVIVREAYSPARHFNEEVIRDPFDGKKLWAVNQIEWMIRKGDTIDTNMPLIKTFQFHIAQRDAKRSFVTDIVVSQNEPSFLPSSLKQAGATRLCRVTSNLDGVQQHQLVAKQKRGSCFSRGYRYYVCEFEVRIAVEAADLRFELWLGGERFSGNHEPIGVEWDAEGARNVGDGDGTGDEGLDNAEVRRIDVKEWRL
ncbi:hypothetical protein E4U21_002431 [Claviceps maximensis]|nr:hypothetical protein E4U21_002431 [Claviceps maximensis]